MSEKELEKLATSEVNVLYPEDQRHLLSVNKCDWKAGFIAGYKYLKEELRLEREIKSCGP